MNRNIHPLWTEPKRRLISTLEIYCPYYKTLIRLPLKAFFFLFFRWIRNRISSRSQGGKWKFNWAFKITITKINAGERRVPALNGDDPVDGGGRRQLEINEWLFYFIVHRSLSIAVTTNNLQIYGLKLRWHCCFCNHYRYLIIFLISFLSLLLSLLLVSRTAFYS